MPSSQTTSRPLRTWLHGTSLIIVSTAIYLAAVAASLYSLEMAYYNPQKWDIIKQAISNGEYFDQKVANQLSYEAKQYMILWNMVQATKSMNPGQGSMLEGKRGSLASTMEALMAASPTVIRVSVETPDGEVLVFREDRSRLRLQHTFSNSILTKSFANSVQQSFITDPPESKLYGLLRITVTTPKGNNRIDDHTTYYRWLMLATVALYTVIYFGLLYAIIFPLSRVLTYMQARHLAAPIIRKPRSLLEWAYNELARDAALTRFSKELRDRITAGGISHADRVLEMVPEIANDHAGVPFCQVWLFGRRMAKQGWYPERTFSTEVSWFDTADFRARITEAINQNDPLKDAALWKARTLHYQAVEGDPRPYFCDILHQTQDRLMLFVVQNPPKLAPPSAWWVDYFSRVAQELRYALTSVEDQRRLILQEKSKANISLSRNLGHDLTNIIATSKLELMTIKAFLSLTPAEVNASPRKQEIFRESLEALLNNTRILQEIVNLYRSFSYLQKPKFEEVAISEMVDDVINLYGLSLSKSISIGRDLATDLPVTRVEPRLLRLALFNILQNAYEAIKRATSTENPEGRIMVRTGFNAERARIEITVEDSGSGIRDEAGNLLSDDRLSEIFRLGFSTKANQEGEGLGLNWVQQIVREFHGGEVVARNREGGGGAAFTIRLPAERTEPSPKTPAKDSGEVKLTRV